MNSMELIMQKAPIIVEDLNRRGMHQHAIFFGKLCDCLITQNETVESMRKLFDECHTQLIQSLAREAELAANQ